MMRTVASRHVVTVADRGVPFSAEISPTMSPETRIANKAWRPSARAAVTLTRASSSTTTCDSRRPSHKSGSFAPTERFTPSPSS
jgi:hypothetical protein